MNDRKLKPKLLKFEGKNALLIENVRVAHIYMLFNHFDFNMLLPLGRNPVLYTTIKFPQK